ncbi:MAG: hydrogenase maturation protein, partial [Candidatus Accumulibacter sp.]|nr:hydrogenase maturation protein [Accumulibacter sp.]
SQLTIAALQGDCGAGGCFLARAADLVWARAGVLLNPHYRNMGNLFGSEYWTYLLPARVGVEGARTIMRNRLPMSATAGVSAGLVDACLASDPDAFRIDVARRATELAVAPELAARLRAKRAQRHADEALKPLASYRAEELAELQRNFYGFDPSYHVARYHFVHKTPASWTPRHLAIHRDLGWSVPR